MNEKNTPSSFFKQQNMPISVEKCLDADIPVLVEVAKITYAETYPGLFTSDELDKLFSVEQCKKDLVDPNCCVFVARSGNNILGYAKIIMPHEAHGMLIDKIYVLKEAKGKRIGDKLMRTCCQFAVDNNMQKAEVFVFDTNLNIKGFYEKFGFRETEKKIPYSKNGKVVGFDHVMVCDDVRVNLRSSIRSKL